MSRNVHLYTSHYCEENIYKILESLSQLHSISEFSVVFLSNSLGVIPLYAQKLASHPDAPVFWDYHVVLIHHKPGFEALVYDFDTTIESFPVAFSTYSEKTFIPFPPQEWLERNGCSEEEIQVVRNKYKRLFRVVPGTTYLNSFASHRGHMLDEDGSWKAVPPVWSCIKGSAAISDHTLDHFLDFSQEELTNDRYGNIMGEEDLLKQFIP